jgi:hypothetical protein
MATDKSKGFTQREIGAALNNAVLLALSPRKHPISPERQFRLREYSQGLIEIVLETLEDGATPEELVAILSGCALTIHASHVMKTDKLPALKELHG